MRRLADVPYASNPWPHWRELSTITWRHDESMMRHISFTDATDMCDIEKLGSLSLNFLPHFFHQLRPNPKQFFPPDRFGKRTTTIHQQALQQTCPPRRTLCSSRPPTIGKQQSLSQAPKHQCSTVVLFWSRTSPTLPKANSSVVLATDLNYYPPGKQRP